MLYFSGIPKREEDLTIEQKKREIQYDYLRALAVFAVITVHSIPEETLNFRQWLFSAALTPLLLTSVCIYFMISGMFILKSGTEDIPGFYRKRFLNIFIPFVFYSGIYYWYYEIYLGEEGLSPGRHLAAFAKEFFTGTTPQAPHLWFMYALLALYLCAPFLARMFKAMSDKELKIFLVLILTVQAGLTYLPPLGLDMGESLGYMVFKGWFIYFILGYACRRLYRRGNYLPFGLLGLAGFLITILQKYFTPSFMPGIHDMAPTMTAMAVSIFLFFEEFGNRRLPVLAKAAGFISRRSFSVYLIHYLVLGQAAEKLVETTSIRHFYVPKILCTAVLVFFISLALSWILDETVVKLLKRGIGAVTFEKKVVK